MLRDVFEDTLRALKLVDRSDPVTSLIAKKIIELARRGERDRARLRQAAVGGVLGCSGDCRLVPAGAVLSNPTKREGIRWSAN
jgi:hypothetical protein